MKQKYEFIYLTKPRFEVQHYKMHSKVIAVYFGSNRFFFFIYRNIKSWTHYLEWNQIMNWVNCYMSMNYAKILSMISK